MKKYKIVNKTAIKTGIFKLFSHVFEEKLLKEYKLLCCFDVDVLLLILDVLCGMHVLLVTDMNVVFFLARFFNIFERCKARETIYGIDASEFSLTRLSIINT
jgi:hypothetical protein